MPLLMPCMPKKVIVITDNLVAYPLQDFSISEIYVDYVVSVDAIGDPKGIVSGTTQITRDPVGLVMASHAAQVIANSGLLKDGFSFQTGAGGASLADAKFLKDIMLERGIQGSFGLSGITGYMVDIYELKEKAEKITGKPAKLPKGDRVVAEVIGRNGDLQDLIYNVRG